MDYLNDGFAHAAHFLFGLILESLSGVALAKSCEFVQPLGDKLSSKLCSDVKYVSLQTVVGNH